ncbi:unconventional myosin-Ic-like isoform X1 [Lates japonicus]|uniref:Unconventional myosin-Ic-like isoform X1 n=1 Tax=Lates japonicus TaxID=270547 RepID=A0AAD3QW22_LATJO|nr:unconventional myosin-Ic-like isoform X1 [Lates japonicus]
MRTEERPVYSHARVRVEQSKTEASKSSSTMPSPAPADDVAALSDTPTAVQPNPVLELLEGGDEDHSTRYTWTETPELQYHSPRVSSISDKNNWKVVMKALPVIGFTEEECRSCASQTMNANHFRRRDDGSETPRDDQKSSSGSQKLYFTTEDALEAKK